MTGTGPLEAPLERTVGRRTAQALAPLGIVTAHDLLRHYPRRYAEPGRMTDLRDLTVGEHVALMARVRQATVRQMRSRGGALLEAVVTDGERDLTLTFFARRPGVLRTHEDRLRPGRVAMFTGTVGTYRGRLQLTHPDYQVVGQDADDEAAALVEASRPIPVYRASAALPTWRISRAVRTVLDTLGPDDLPDPLPEQVRRDRGLVGLIEALSGVHAPYTDADWQAAQHRLRFEEAFVLQVALARRRAAVAELDAVARPPVPGGLLDTFDASLPFRLTPGQVDVGREIAQDLARPHPMQRLLQGEVGSGKTLVALRAMLQVVDAGGQAALLAPTEVLAAQHARSLRRLLGTLADDGFLTAAEAATRVALLTGSAGAGARREALADAAGGRAGIVVGTHALLGPQVQFADLGLVVVDEQHRFGVEQRDSLRRPDGTRPHLLVMTATPIPRTVAMTVFGDLETSVLRDLPPGRSPITTHVVPADNQAWTARMWQRVREEVDAGHRAYVVCPRIAPDDTPEEDDAGTPVEEEPPGPGTRPSRAVVEVADELQDHPALAGVEVGVLHGRLAPADKDRVMAQFAAGEVQVLVATTVVEVGVDVPEATVMVVLDADRFGLSQLHQLRGRVGRGAAPGLCLLVSGAVDGTDARSRVEAIAGTTDGFELAAVDLDLRREGDVLGVAQSGATSSLRLLRVARDGKVIAEARRDARAVIEQDRELTGHPELRRAIAAVLDPGREEFLERA
ncbi:ATP-dependent DNA helicase RecG [Cellulomonas bogoriensis]